MPSLGTLPDGWLTDGLRFTAFPTHQPSLSDLQEAWKEIAGSAPVNASSRDLGKRLEVSGVAATFSGSITASKTKVDLVLKPTQEVTPGVIGGLGPWGSAVALLHEKARALLRHLSAVNRLGFCPELVRDATQESAATIIDAYYGPLPPTWSNGKDMQIRLNIPRASAARPDTVINRLVSTQMAIVGWGQFSGGIPSLLEIDVAQLENSRPILQMHFDINNAKLLDALDGAAMIPLLSELSSACEQIVREGYRE